MTRPNGAPRFALTLLSAISALACSGEDSPGGTGGSGIVANLELEAEDPEPFSSLSGVREPPDGRLMAADPLSQVLLRVDMDAGTADTLGRVGGGPQEYEQPDHVFPLPGDSTLLVDLGKTYLTVIGPDGTFHSGMSMALPTEDGRPSIIFPRAVDASGRIYFEGMGGMRDGPQDSTSISRYDRATGTTETVAAAWRTPPVVTGSRGDAVMLSLPRMVPNDDWAVGADGRIAVVRANGYFVEWHMSDGTVVSGPETPYEVHSIAYEDKEADLEESSGAGLAVMISRSTSGEARMQMSRGGFGGGGDQPTVEDQEWGDEFPPFRQRRSRVTPFNEVWVQRWLPVDREPMMDIFGPDGRLEGSVLIPRDRQLIGFGQASDGGLLAYLVRIDEVDLQWLERYRVVRE